MKVLFFTRLFYPHVGGVETHVMEVTKRLEAMGHTVIIITEELSGTQAQQSARFVVDQINATVYRIPVGKDEKKKKFLIWSWLREHKNLIEDADIIHAHDVFFWYLPFRFRYPRKKVYTTFHGYESFPIRKKAIVYRKLFELLSFGTVCIGSFMKKWYYANPDFISYGGVSLPYISEKKYKKNSAIFIGRLDEQTGIDIYQEMVEKLRLKFDKTFCLNVYGDGPYRKKLDDSIGVTLLGFDRTASSQIQNYQFAFISRYLAILEALLSKSLVIAVYDNPVKRDYLLMSPFADYIVTEGSADKAIEKMKFFILNPNRMKKMINAGHEWAEKQTWEKVTEMYLKLWSK